MRSIVSIGQIAIPFVFLLEVSCMGCNKQPAKADANVAGYVIDHEICHEDAAQDYWLLDMSIRTGTPPVGDTLTINNTTYTNVVKIRNLNPDLQIPGLRVSIDYHSITEKRQTSGCTLSSVSIYALREIIPIRQGQLR